MEEIALVLEMLREIRDQIKNLKTDIDRMTEASGNDRERIARLETRVDALDNRNKSALTVIAVIISGLSFLTTIIFTILKLGGNP